MAEQNTYHLAKKDVITDPMLPPAVTYFLMKDMVHKKNWSIEVLFSRDYDTEWSLNDDNWTKASFNHKETLESLN
tara:strand:- start:338 stop:562 length:225 start_codon:yes stop_codon:yes gene_type:complete